MINPSRRAAPRHRRMRYNLSLPQLDNITTTSAVRAIRPSSPANLYFAVRESGSGSSRRFRRLGHSASDRGGHGSADQIEFGANVVGAAPTTRRVALYLNQRIFLCLIFDVLRAESYLRISISIKIYLQPTARGEGNALHSASSGVPAFSRSARNTASAVSGNSVSRTPTASSSALAMAGDSGSVADSPTPLAPNGALC
jgi:hypothetical protein